jgi:hypothetical protein
MGIKPSGQEGFVEMSNSGSIRKFEYRPCRITTGFDVDFMPTKETFHGICKNVSNSGIRATFYDPLSAGDSGLLILRHPIGILELNATIVYAEETQMGFEFLFPSPRECAMTAEYMDLIVDQAASPLIFRFR